jgi:ABC-type Fe3+-hydroxamate transport system substrate-binding protein
MRPAPHARIGWAVAALAIVLAAACGERAPETPPGAGPRIVSLSPALSRTLVDLGLGPLIVGRSRYCDFLDPAVPIAGDLLAADYERLVDLAPTHLAIQAPASGVDGALLAFAAEHGWRVGQWTSIDAVDDIERVVRELPPFVFEPGTPELERATFRSAELLVEIAEALSPGPDAAVVWRGTTLIVYAREPVGVFGRGTYLGEVLSRLGGTNAVEADGWAELTLEDVTRLNPGAIMLVVDPAAEEGDPAVHPGPLATLDVDAVRDGRIALLRHPDAWRPCTGIIGVADEMRAALRGLATPGGPES